MDTLVCDCMLTLISTNRFFQMDKIQESTSFSISNIVVMFTKHKKAESVNKKLTTNVHL